jgi:hypothetical protein
MSINFERSTGALRYPICTPSELLVVRHPGGTWGDTIREDVAWGLGHRALAGEWDIDGPALQAKLTVMPEALMRMLVRAIDRFWNLYMNRRGTNAEAGRWCLERTGLVRCRAGHAAFRRRDDCDACLLTILGAAFE